jgi:hypothetical protein
MPGEAGSSFMPGLLAASLASLGWSGYLELTRSKIYQGE